MTGRNLAFAIGVFSSVGFQIGFAAEDKRVEQPKGYHIVRNPDRTGETPAELKHEKAEEDNNSARKRNTTIGNQSAPTREPELKPREIKP